MDYMQKVGVGGDGPRRSHGRKLIVASCYGEADVAFTVGSTMVCIHTASMSTTLAIWIGYIPQVPQ